ncbi:hypothetical protein [Bifidobacterium apri]|uniref:Uncharacterized protein n=1 Tax=Bifidobacterium apri TaxID=1769423 RepID=A0A6A2VT55_9BIFI|nr:hypothetical protein [Bifidobacterium apri]KAB8292718.1 hypothetical protein DSM100238_1770 [Bifidobacterium apri]
MLQVNIWDDFDWPTLFHDFQSDKASYMGKAITAGWIKRQCRIACRMVITQCPGAVSRYRKGDLDQETIAYVITTMVMRVAIWQRQHTESNGTYSYTDDAPSDTPPGFTPSPNLFLRANEKALINGGDDSGIIGTAGIGIADYWGG